MSIKLSVLKRSMRPRSRSLTRGCVTRRILAALAWVSRPRGECLLKLDQQVGSNQEVLGFFGGEPRSRTHCRSSA